MERLLSLIITILIFTSCSNYTENENRNKVLKYVLEDRLELANSCILLEPTKDTIIVEDIKLIAQSFAQIKVDSASECFIIFSKNAPSFIHPFLRDDNDKHVIEKLENIHSKIWDTTTLNINVEFTYPLFEDSNNQVESMKGQQVVDLELNHLVRIDDNYDEESYLYISEPLFNKLGEAIVSTKLYTKDYQIEKLYYFSLIQKNIKLIEKRTVLLELSKPKIEKYNDVNGKEVIKNTRSAIVIGYFDI